MRPTENGLTVLDLADLEADGPRQAAFRSRMLAATRGSGFFYLVNHGIPDALCQAVLRTTRAFFQLPARDKHRVDIGLSTNFRGYSVMENERDFREQLHFGWDWPEGAWAPGRPEYYRLAGPNPWPTDPPDFANTLGTFLACCRRLGNQLLIIYAAGLGLPPDHFERLSPEPPYLLLKQIAYRPQTGLARRSGVAGHCDWSWFTLLLQDDVGGLSILDEAGQWVNAPPMAHALSVNTGELMEYVSGGQFRATPHRVTNPSAQRTRVSVPVFINPPLGATIASTVPPALRVRRGHDRIHIHRVLAPGADSPAFVFGASEWRRKGQGKWCHLCADST